MTIKNKVIVFDTETTGLPKTRQKPNKWNTYLMIRQSTLRPHRKRIDSLGQSLPHKYPLKISPVATFFYIAKRLSKQLIILLNYQKIWKFLLNLLMFTVLLLKLC